MIMLPAKKTTTTTTPTPQRGTVFCRDAIHRVLPPVVRRDRAGRDDELLQCKGGYVSPVILSAAKDLRSRHAHRWGTQSLRCAQDDRPGSSPFLCPCSSSRPYKKQQPCQKPLYALSYDVSKWMCPSSWKEK